MKRQKIDIFDKPSTDPTVGFIIAMVIAGAGGFLGTCLRYCAMQLGLEIHVGDFPMGVLIANVSACFLMGLFFGLIERAHRLGKHWRLFLITGVCGGLSTFSAMCDDLTDMLDRGADASFWIYLTVSLVAGLGMVALGTVCVPKRSVKPAQPLTPRDV